MQSRFMQFRFANWSALARCAAMLLLAVIALGITTRATAENWPGWRGPQGDGTSQETQLPIHWDGTSGKNVAWKVELPGTGHASPVIWGERIYLIASQVVESDTADTPPQADRLLICLDTSSGRTLWKRVVFRSPLEGKHPKNSYASGTPLTDGRSVWVSFLDGEEIVVAAYSVDGALRWQKRPGEFHSKHGFCSSPVLFEDKVIINGDHDGDSYIVALDGSSGETVWKVDRENKTRSYCTPLIRQVDGRTQMFISGSKCVASYDPRTGSRHWILDGPTDQFVASLLYSHDLVLLTCGFPERHIVAIRPDGSGNVTDTHVAWRTRKGAAYVPSPVVVGDYFVVVSDGGVASCFDVVSGEQLWMKRLGSKFSASGVVIDALACFTSEDGITSMIRPGADLDVVATNALGEACFASPAISAGRIYLRGEQHLFAIGP
jgi:hypothetical protein